MSKKKKHIYSDSRKNGLDIVVSSRFKDVHNPMKQMEALYHLIPNDWTTYISDIMYDKYPITRKDVWEDTSYILNEINNSTTNRYILKRLMKEELFNPRVDDFPIYIFDTATKNLIKKKQKFLEKYGKYKNAFIYKGFNVLVLHNDTRIDLSLYHKIFDIVITFNSYSVIISIAKETKKYFDLNALYKQFNEIEPNIWNTNKSKTILYVCNNKKTKIKIYDNQDLLNECLDIIIFKDADSFINQRNENYIKNFVSNN